MWTSSHQLVPARAGDGRALLVIGRRELWKTLAPVDRSGLMTIDNIVMTPDAQSCAYSYSRTLASLQLAEGLR